MDHYYLDYEPLSNIFYVADSVIKRFEDEGKIPILELSAHDHMKIGCVSPDFDAPIIGFLASRSGNCYSISVSNVQALVGKGFRIRLLTYEHCEQQLRDCNGVVLIGASFVFPKRYYAEPWDRGESASEICVQACLICLHQAIEQKIPILGIGDGALVVAGDFGLKMYPSVECIETPIKHMTSNKNAHRLNVFPETFLSELLEGQNQVFVNSRHTEILAPLRAQYAIIAEKQGVDISKVQLPLDIYAEANDGVLEAWGDKKLNLLCVQWFPGNDPEMHYIYKWFADKVKSLR